jgi:hypothetical protein
LTNLTVSQTFDATGARLAARLASPGGTASNISSGTSGFGGNVSLAYDAGTGAYTVRDMTGASFTFAPADKLPLQNGGSSAAVALYEKDAGTRTDQLALFNPGAGNPELALTYVSYGAWQTILDNGATVDVAQQFFVYGIRQSPTQPSTGSASYQTRPDGFWMTPGGVYSLSGTSSFTADFSAMTVATSLNLTGTSVTGGANKVLGTFNGSGTIAALGGAFNGTLGQQGTDADGNVYSGTFAGAFFGPQGQEVGYTFRLQGTGGQAVGAVVGKAN